MCGSLFGKLLCLTTHDKELQTFVYKRIFMYAITRILPAVNNKKMLNEVSHDNIKLMLSYYSSIHECCLDQLKRNQSDELLKEMKVMVEERIFYLKSVIEVLKVVL